MFGYVRPYRPELKCKDFDLYRATYCGLCRCLRRRYGLIAPLFLNFDFTFLALVLWEAEGQAEFCRGRCYANPLVKKTMCMDSPALELAADESVILTWWKLRDSVKDDGLWGGMPARLLAGLLAVPAFTAFPGIHAIVFSLIFILIFVWSSILVLILIFVIVHVVHADAPPHESSSALSKLFVSVYHFPGAAARDSRKVLHELYT